MLCQWATNGVIPSLSGSDHLPRPRPNHQSVRKYNSYMHVQIRNLAAADVISPVDTKPSFVLPLKLVAKSNGKPRLVWNGRKLNERTRAPHFKLPTPHRIVKYIPRGSYMTRLDISNAYWSVPIHPDHRHYFGLSFNGQYYVWNCLPFGWNVSAWALNQSLEHVRKYIQHKYGIKLFIYSDDFLIVAEDAETTRLHTDIVLRELALFGFAVQPDKCVLTPSQQCDYLGMRIDSANGTVSLTPQRRRSYLHLLRWLRHQDTLSVLQMQKVVGYLNFVAPTWPGSRILFTPWIRAIAERSPQDTHLYVDKRYLRQLILCVKRNAPFRFISDGVNVYSDATPTQGGICWDNGNYIRLHWPSKGIFVQETRAAAWAICETAVLYPNHRIIIYIDNQASLYALRKGTSPIRNIWPYLFDVYSALQAHNCTISYRYIPSAKNPADYYSRS